MMDDKEEIVLTLTEEETHTLLQMAKNEGLTVDQLVEKLLTEYLDKLEKDL